ncbi:rho guanine nucleotide exchange factor 7-like isoform X1 [Carassius auratus]|uniref:Rho guanine nucleotide exchange factor 7-like isoform X1 n=1 Tax=Carassius auratus TaxID=7957 RepID=A0A6P6Q1S0_CARAU|nr:rho guanine nucleotide exchange factor 7-like isoform X1 [Carassius auratus]XP_026127899.1 rho guanine nucleotide exchange factor 7-like isoform X1 [Carassius auratus]XP_052422237.1 rho guanine nucleotide exchange factor 7 isoform X1 [Carassius gibelio]
MNPAEQTVTWLITLGVLESPKKTISDPDGFLQSSLRDGVVLCRLLERLRPGTTDKIYQDPKNDSECLSNITEFLKGCAVFRVEPFEAGDLFQGHNFSRVLTTLVVLNKVTADIGIDSDSVCTRHSSAHRIKSFESLASQSSLGRSSKLLHNQFRSLVSNTGDMTENSNAQLVVKARFNFQQTNEDELSFSKGDIINVTRTEEGGWWEGSLNGKTGWFPSNYVREVKGSDKQVSPKSGTLKSPPKGFDTTSISKTYYNLVLQNILETETEYSKELQNLLTNYLRPLQMTDKLSPSDVSVILGNLEEISTFQQTLVQSLEDTTKLPELQQRVGGFFLNLMPQMRSLYVSYCSNHPSAVSILTDHSEELGEFMEGRGASIPGILTLTSGLSKPFMRLDKYPTLLKELERHMEEGHPDRTEIQKCMTAFKNLSAQCQEVRKRKELELQILVETIRLWEGEDIKTLGSVLYMSQAMVQNHGCEDKHERYLLLFPHVLLILSASPRMSGFIYQGKLPLSGMTVTPLEDCESHKNAFELSGSRFERLQVICYNKQDLQDWLEHLNRQTKHNTMAAPSMKPLNVPCHTLPSHPLTPSRHAESRGLTVAPAYHTLPHPSSHGAPHSTMMWGPLEPPKTQKPWSLSCLRPAPPLRPSAALCYKEDLSKSPKTMKKLLPKRKPERKPSDEEFALRKSTVALEEDAQILKVIEAYCTSAKTRQTLNSRQWKDASPALIVPGEEKFSVDKLKSNGQTLPEEKSLVDVVYALRDEVQELKKDYKKMKKSLEEEQRARKDLERIVRKMLKNINDSSWDETNL